MIYNFIKQFILFCFISFVGRIYFAFSGSLFSNVESFLALIWGIRFDLAVAGVFAFISLLLNNLFLALKIKNRYCNRTIASSSSSSKLITSTLSAILITMQLADIAYYQESGRHVSYEIHNISSIIPNLIALLPHHFGKISAIIIIFILLYFWPGFISYMPRKAFNYFTSCQSCTLTIARIFTDQVKSFFIIKKHKINRIIIKFVEFIVILSIVVVSIRGGITGIPQEPSFAFKLSDPTRTLIALNGVYSILFNFFVDYSIQKITLSVVNSKLRNKLVKQLYINNSIGPLNTISQTVPQKKMNFVFVFLESWGVIYSKSYGSAYDATPEFDKLRKLGITTQELISGGHRTTEGLFSVFCSFQNPLGQTVANTQLQALPYKCLPRMLFESGWNTVFYQGSDADTSGVGAFSQTIGFAKSFGKRDYSNVDPKKTNEWGLFDFYLYDYVLKDLATIKEPFLIGINTTTTHDSLLPDNVKPFIKNSSDEANYINVLHSADEDLGTFIRTFSNKKTQYPIVFVLVADHTAFISSSNFNQYRLPFVIYSHEANVIPAKFLPIVAHQRDIAPTIANFLDMEVPWFAGQNILDTKRLRISEYYHLGTLGWIDNKHLMEISLTEQNNIKCYNWEQDPLLKKPQTCPLNSEQSKNRMLGFTSYSQDLLFQGKTLNFGDCKNSN